MHLTIAIPAFNEEKLLPETLAAIQDSAKVFEAMNWDWELVVCDNNSSDRTAELARDAGARVVFESQTKSPEPGMQPVRRPEEIDHFVDVTKPSPELFAATGKAMQQSDILGGGSTLTMGVVPLWAAFWVHLWNWISRVMRWPAGSYFLPHESFPRTGRVFQDPYASEELEFAERLKRHGRRRQQRLHIITGQPLITSARKLSLYSPWELVRLLIATATGGRALGDPKACSWWYDGRR